MEMILYAVLFVLFGIIGLVLAVHDRGRRIQALEEEKMALIGRLAACGSSYQALASKIRPGLARTLQMSRPPAAMEGISSGRPIFTDAKGYRWPIDLDKPGGPAAALKRRKSDQR